MMLPLGGRPLIWHAWRRCVEAFGEANVVVAIPDTEENELIRKFIEEQGGQVFRWDGPENDVLGRIYHAAHALRWKRDSVILRVTPDDPFKDPKMMMRVAMGERHPVELSAEGMTLEWLEYAHAQVTNPEQREHLTHILSPVPPPPPPPGVWTVDTREDYEAIKAIMEKAA